MSLDLCTICDRNTTGELMTCYICHAQICRLSTCSHQAALPGFVKMFIFCSQCYALYPCFRGWFANELEGHQGQVALFFQQWRERVKGDGR